MCVQEAYRASHWLGIDLMREDKSLAMSMIIRLLICNKKARLRSDYFKSFKCLQTQGILLSVRHHFNINFVTEFLKAEIFI